MFLKDLHICTVGTYHCHYMKLESEKSVANISPFIFLPVLPSLLSHFRGGYPFYSPYTYLYTTSPYSSHSYVGTLQPIGTVPIPTVLSTGNWHKIAALTFYSICFKGIRTGKLLNMCWEKGSIHGTGWKVRFSILLTCADPLPPPLPLIKAK